MTPIDHFDAVWRRCAELTSLHAYLASNVTGVLTLDELLRAEWVARVSALDLYVHELVSQAMVAIFEGRRAQTPAYLRFRVTAESLGRIRTSTNLTDASAAFDLEVRAQLALSTYQDPEKIAEGIRLCSEVELWNEIAIKMGSSPATKVNEAKRIKKDLSLVVQRRNKIAHEGDLQPTAPREPWSIDRTDLATVSQLIEAIVRSIDALV